MLICKRCNQHFAPNTSQQIFCSNACKIIYHNRIRRGLPLNNYISPYNGTIEQRFWLKVDKNGPIPNLDTYGDIGPCWMWVGGKDSYGYGHIRMNGKTVKAHQCSYILHMGDIPAGYEICHRCDQPACVNPKHIWADTHQNNMRDCWQKGRFTSVVNFSLLHNTNLHLLTNEQLEIIIKNARQEISQRMP